MIVPIRQVLVIRSLFEFYLFLIVATLFLLNEMSTTVLVTGTVLLTFFFVMRLNITIVTSYDSLIVILVIFILVTQFLSLKLENGLKKDVRNVAGIKYGFVKLVVILFTFNTRPNNFFYFKYEQKNRNRIEA